MTDNTVSKPTVTYTVMWVDENGKHVEAQQGLSLDDALIKVNENKDFGWHSYPAAEDVLSAVLMQGGI